MFKKKNETGSAKTPISKIAEIYDRASKLEKKHLEEYRKMMLKESSDAEAAAFAGIYIVETVAHLLTVIAKGDKGCNTRVTNIVLKHIHTNLRSMMYH